MAFKRIINIFDLHSSAFGPVQISWLGDTSAYVALKEHPENAKLVMKTLSCAAPGVAGLAPKAIVFLVLLINNHCFPVDA